MHQKDAHTKMWLLSACIMSSFQCDMSGKARSTSSFAYILDYEMGIKKRKKEVQFNGSSRLSSSDL